MLNFTSINSRFVQVLYTHKTKIHTHTNARTGILAIIATFCAIKMADILQSALIKSETNTFLFCFSFFFLFFFFGYSYLNIPKKAGSISKKPIKIFQYSLHDTSFSCSFICYCSLSFCTSLCSSGCGSLSSSSLSYWRIRRCLFQIFRLSANSCWLIIMNVYTFFV